jgi:hypothetical protein
MSWLPFDVGESRDRVAFSRGHWTFSLPGNCIGLSEWKLDGTRARDHAELYSVAAPAVLNLWMDSSGQNGTARDGLRHSCLGSELANWVFNQDCRMIRGQKSHLPLAARSNGPQTPQRKKDTTKLSPREIGIPLSMTSIRRNECRYILRLFQNSVTKLDSLHHSLGLNGKFWWWLLEYCRIEVTELWKTRKCDRLCLKYSVMCCQDLLTGSKKLFR